MIRGDKRIKQNEKRSRKRKEGYTYKKLPTN